jgi:hypothetical protein
MQPVQILAFEVFRYFNQFSIYILEQWLHFACGNFVLYTVLLPFIAFCILDIVLPIFSVYYGLCKLMCQQSDILQMYELAV